MKSIDILKLEYKRMPKNYFFIFSCGIILLFFMAYSQTLFSYGLYYDPSLDILMRYAPFQELATVKYIDTVFPILACIVTIILFYDDYKGKIYEIIYTYNSSKFNKVIFIRWVIIFSIFLILSVLSAYLAYKQTVFIGDKYSDYSLFALKNDFISIVLKSIPTLLFYTIFPIVTIVIFKNMYISICIILLFAVMDINGFLYIYPFGAMWNSNLYSVLKKFVIYNESLNSIGFNINLFRIAFVVNRISISFLSIVSLVLTCKLNPIKSFRLKNNIFIGNMHKRMIKKIQS